MDPPFARVELDGAVRTALGLENSAPTVLGAWEHLRVMKVRVDPQLAREGHLLNPVVTLNLGPDVSGEWNLERAGWQPYKLAHHSISVIPAAVPYSNRFAEAREVVFAELAGGYLGRLQTEAAMGGSPQLVLGQRDEYARHLLLALVEEARRGPSDGSALRATGLAQALAGHLLEQRLDVPVLQSVPSLSSPKLRRVLEYIATHLDTPLTLQTLTGLAEMDMYRFIRAFKQSTGSSPHRYVLEARINRAKDLLRQGERSITEIALETGFATPSHFSVTFRRLVNVTPRAFRDQALGAPGPLPAPSPGE